MSKILNTDKLLKEVLDMKKDLENDTVSSKENYKSKYNYLSTFSPTLFDMVYKNEKDYMNLLNDMVKSANKIKKKNLSQHQADVEIGEKLASIYVHPIVDMEKEKK